MYVGVGEGFVSHIAPKYCKGFITLLSSCNLLQLCTSDYVGFTFDDCVQSYHPKKGDIVKFHIWFKGAHLLPQRYCVTDVKLG